MLFNLITLLDNFGFNINYSEFESVNLFPINAERNIIPKLTPKTNKRIIAINCDKLKKKNILNNAFFKRFGSPIFFNLKKIYFNSEELSDYIKIFYSENNDAFNIVENYIMKH